MSNTVCRHCGKEPATRPRGLGWTCYYTDGVKEQYPPTSPHANAGVGNISGGHALAAEPTQHPPGSPGKIAVMQERVAAQVSLFHPGDAGGRSFGEVPPGPADDPWYDLLAECRWRVEGGNPHARRVAAAALGVPVEGLDAALNGEG